MAETHDEFTPITSQEQLDGLIKDRLSRKEKSIREEYSDYEDLKAKAAKYDEAQDAAKSELEKAQERAQKAEAEAQSLREAKERADIAARVSAATGVPVTLIQGADEDSMTASAKAIADYAQSIKPSVPSDRGGAGHPSKTPLSDSDIQKMTNPLDRVMAYAQRFEDNK